MEMESNFQEPNAFKPIVEPEARPVETEPQEQPKPLKAEEPQESQETQEKKFTFAPEEKPQEPVKQEIKTVDGVSNKAIANYQEDSIKSIQEQVREGKMDMKEAAKDLGHVIGYSKAMEDSDKNKNFNEKFVEKKQKEMLASADTAVAEEQTKQLEAQRKANEQYYKSYRPILEMDLSPFLHNDKKKKKVKEKIVEGQIVRTEEPDDEEVAPKKPEYSDRGYGIPYMRMMICLLIIPYMIAALILSVINIIKAIFLGINSIFEAFSRFSKPALIICSGIAGVTLIGLFIYVVLLCVQSMFNIQIIPETMAVAETLMAMEG